MSFEQLMKLSGTDGSFSDEKVKDKRSGVRASVIIDIVIL